ncbi:MAG: hypothetical protein AB7K09_12340 [Planctomycetota bacterium]
MSRVLLLCLLVAAVATLVLPGCSRDGTFRLIIRANVNQAGVPQGNGVSNMDDVRLDGGGRYVVFTHSMSLVSLDTNGVDDVYRYDTVERRIQRISVSSSGLGGPLPSIRGFASGDATAVIFQTQNSFDVGHTQGTNAVYLNNLVTGQTLLVAVDAVPTGISFDGTTVAYTSGGQVYVATITTFPPVVAAVANGDHGQLSGDGRYLAFESDDTSLVAGAPGAGHTGVFVADMQLVTPTFTCVSRNYLGAVLPTDARLHDFSSDGRVVVFDSNDTVVSTIGGGAVRIYTNDWQEAQPTLRHIGALRSSSYGRHDMVRTARVSGDGRYVLIEKGPVPYTLTEVFDRQTGEFELASSDAASLDPGGECLNGDISDDGLRVAFIVSDDAVQVIPPAGTGVFVAER